MSSLNISAAASMNKRSRSPSQSDDNDIPTAKRLQKSINTSSVFFQAPTAPLNTQQHELPNQKPNFTFLISVKGFFLKNGDVWDVYTGIINNKGEPHGRGTMTSPNGDKFVGNFLDGKFHGHMTSTFGSTYTGEWEHGMIKGRGTMTSANGDKYVGNFKYGKLHGNGTMTYFKGDIYVGQWENNLKHGHGTMTYFKGDIYVGQWENDEKHGHGIMADAYETIYSGEWKNGKKHGHGIMAYADETIYFGEWDYDEKHGHGTMTYADGETYAGEWHSNLREYYGALTCDNGDIHVGEWQADLPNGYCVVRNRDRIILEEGIWENGELIDENTSLIPGDFHQSIDAMNTKISEVNSLCIIAKEKAKNAYKKANEKYIEINAQKHIPGLNIVTQKMGIRSRIENTIPIVTLGLIGQFLVEPLFTTEQEKVIDKLFKSLLQSSSSPALTS